MVVGDLYVAGVAIPPDEADAPLVVDADAMLPLSVAIQLLKPGLAVCHPAPGWQDSGTAFSGGTLDPTTTGTSIPNDGHGLPLLDGCIGGEQGAVQLFSCGHNQAIHRLKGAEFAAAEDDLRRQRNELVTRRN